MPQGPVRNPKIRPSQRRIGRGSLPGGQQDLPPPPGRSAGDRLAGSGSGSGRWRVPCLGGTFRLRQKHLIAAFGWPGDPQQRSDQGWGALGGGAAALATGRCHGVPELCPLSPPECAGQHRLWAAAQSAPYPPPAVPGFPAPTGPQLAQGPAGVFAAGAPYRSPGRRGGWPAGAGCPTRSAPQRTVGGAEAAGGPGAGNRPPALGVPDG